MRMYAKDYVTAGNFLAGFAASLFALEGSLMWAGLMMPVAMFFDASDGIVARLTRRHNRFGGEFDNVADHMSYGIAPAFILYAAYRPVFEQALKLPWLLAVALAFAVGSVPIFFASVRFARFNTYHYKTPGYWLGVPRPATAFALAALVNSHLFALGTQAQLGCILVVLLLGALNASTFPYLNHHHDGKTPGTVWLYYGFFAVTTLLSIALGPVARMLGHKLVDDRFVGDTILFSMGCYAFLGWMEVPASVRKSAREAVIDAEIDDLRSAGEDVSTLRPAPGAAPEPAPAPSFKPNVAAALSYTLLTFTGVLFLRRPYEQDPFVRFHAWQSVFGLIAVGVAFTAVSILHGMAADIWPGFSLLGWVGWPLAAFFAVWWVVMAVQAYRGNKLHAPFIGVQAEKQIA